MSCLKHRAPEIPYVPHVFKLSCGCWQQTFTNQRYSRKKITIKQVVSHIYRTILFLDTFTSQIQLGFQPLKMWLPIFELSSVALLTQSSEYLENIESAQGNEFSANIHWNAFTKYFNNIYLTNFKATYKDLHYFLRKLHLEFRK